MPGGQTNFGASSAESGDSRERARVEHASLLQQLQREFAKPKGEQDSTLITYLEQRIARLQDNFGKPRG